MGVVASRGGRWSLLLVLAVAAFVGLALEGSRSSADDVARTQAVPAPGRLDDLLRGAQPVASMATDASQTFRRPDGSFVTRVFAQPEADVVQAAGDGFRTTSDSGWTTRFPDDLSSPIRVTKASSWLSMELRGGAGSATHDASSVTYKNAVDGVDVEYQSTAAGLGELIHLSGASAPSKLTFDLDASDGLHPVRHDNGVIDVVEADGDRAVALRPSYAFADSDPTRRQPVQTTLTQVDGGWRLELSVDQGWLTKALASGPVTIDPTVELDGAAADCPLTTDVASTSYCGNARLWVGYAGAGDDDHAMVRWDLSSIPATAAVLAGDFGLYQSDTGPNLVKRLDMHRVTRAWTSGASWNTYDGTHAWTAAGGDFDPTPISSAQVPAHHTGWVDWDGTKLVQQWITGGLPNNGVLFKDQSGPAGPAGEEDFFSTSGTIPTQRPELDVLWQARTGAVDSYTLEHQALDAKTSADVNVANGNLLLSTQGISAAGTGVNLELDNYHNSLADSTALGAEGIRGTASLGRDVRLVPAAAGTVAFYRGDGYAGAFIAPQTTGSSTSYTAPLELPGAALSLNTSTHLYTLVLPAGLPSLPGQPLTLTFAATGKLTSIADAAGHAIALGYYSANSTSGLPPLGSILDTNSASWYVDSNYTPDGYIDDIVRAGGTAWNWTYGHLNGDYLTQFTAGDTGQAWHYDYDTSHRLSAITTPDAKVTKITYSGTSSKVASIINTTNPAHTTGPTTTYTYSSPTSPCQSTNFDSAKTVVSRPDNSSTTYCENNYAQVTYDTDNPTTATPSGEWYDLHDQYTQGTGTHSITLTGVDAGAGVKTMSLVEVGGATIASTTLPCDPRNAANPTACPHTATATATFDPSALAEGAHTFEEIVTDYSGHTLASAPWTVSIDRTGPAAPTGIGGVYDADADELSVYWGIPQDPALADGNPGSGTASYVYRYSINGAQFGWQSTPYNGAVITGADVGDDVEVDVYGVDLVGNGGQTGTGTITVALPPDQGSCDARTLGAYPASCITDDEDLSDPDEPIDDVTLSEVTDQAATNSFGAASSEPSKTFTIDVGIPDGKPTVPASTRWATIRNSVQQLVVGNAHNGWRIEADRVSNVTQSPGGGSVRYIRGKLLRPLTGGAFTEVEGPHDGCGWIFAPNGADTYNPLPDPLSDCNSTDPWDNRVSSFAWRTNCGAHTTAVGNGCNGGTPVELKKNTVECANVGLNTATGNTRTGVCDGFAKPLLAGSCVEWRYITGDKKYAMVKDPNVYDYQASWIFIDAKALGNPDALPNIYTGGPSAPHHCSRVPKPR